MLSADLRVPNRGVTGNDVPDPDPLPNIPGAYILVRPVPFKEKIGSIHLPDQFKDDIEHLTNVGRVLVVGDLAYNEPDKTKIQFGRPWCKVGDYVVWGRYGGKKLNYKGVKVVVLADDEVLMTIDNPESINPNANLVKY